MKKVFTSVVAMVIAAAAFAQGGYQMPPMPENVVYYEHNFNMGQVEGRSYNHAPTIFIYPDVRLEEEAAKALVEEFDMRDVLKANHTGVFVINPVGEKYDNAKDFEAFKATLAADMKGSVKKANNVLNLQK